MSLELRAMYALHHCTMEPFPACMCINESHCEVNSVPHVLTLSSMLHPCMLLRRDCVYEPCSITYSNVADRSIKIYQE